MHSTTPFRPWTAGPRWHGFPLILTSRRPLRARACATLTVGSPGSAIPLGDPTINEGISHAAIGSVQDADHELLGVPFVGTDHVLRLNRTRVEAFSGVAEDLFEHLVERRLTHYREEAHARRSSWPTATWDDDWDGPVSIHPDGSVLALRVLPERDC
ncbi:hypothetical protein ACFVX9_01015 [Kitasatospora sp. NPDC058243]|uniref:hypothetical protein n=1 Tax=Kitasatospora sp. NPDC058243 TaxID=3346397 RepID=UPI0036D95CED